MDGGPAEERPGGAAAWLGWGSTAGIWNIGAWVVGGGLVAEEVFAGYPKGLSGREGCDMLPTEAAANRAVNLTGIAVIPMLTFSNGWIARSDRHNEGQPPQHLISVWQIET
jgi:hypothetical protein